MKPFPHSLSPLPAALALAALLGAPTLAGAQAMGGGATVRAAGQSPTQSPVPATASGEPTYVDLVDLARAAPLVVSAEIRKQAQVKAERAPDLRPGYARLYLEADTRALIAGTAPVGERVRYLADVPLRADGKPPKLKETTVLLFARPVPGRRDELQLVAPDAQFVQTPQLDQRVRAILRDLLAGDPPPEIVGVRDALSSRGSLAGESETQIFLATRGGDPASLTVVRRPGAPPRWGISFSELVGSSLDTPARETLAWYRLACALPDRLPSDASLSNDPANRALVTRDYAFVKEDLGPCARNRTPPPGMAPRR